MTMHDFHISKSTRIKYKFDDSFYSLNGNLIITNSQAARYLSDKINEVRKNEGAFDQLTTAGEINALGILHEVYHYLINHYVQKENPGVIKRSIDFLKSALNEEKLNKVLLKFVEEFPPLDVYKGKIKTEEYLNGKTGNKSNKELILEELIILHFENTNPAATRLNELFSDKILKENTLYNELIKRTEEFFDKENPTGFGGLHLFSVLRKPITSNPYNLEEQLLFIKNEWGLILDDMLLSRLLKGTDLIREDYKLFVKHGGGEKATPPVPEYRHETDSLKSLSKEKDAAISLEEAEQFTDDTHWMPEVVMIAKNIYVWMHQLSEKYGYKIKRLNEIPDAELDTLAEWNFTSLWLIGIWERSSASKKIKQLTGNPEAAASAYSLYDYVIANELGGEDAFNDLKHRAGIRGIKLASDMVPNHTGIYSKWVVEKPDYFIRTSIPPYHNYSFTGVNLSEDERVEIRIEDKYYTREDAAVVLERKDNYTGEKVYIYHGNDGTNMPWNDTAQLNLLNPEVREALIQTIKHVAQKTPIIRFDAAMTLTQKHYQRLWFPEPGKGGAIPSRSDYSLTKKEFHEQMPVEFWREVVDRINEEMPNTLLLAEAFWLMEGYFVRTLGMHRVYNSAFMHMLMKEENDKYRKLISNTLEFNPEILKRYVNFMSNPDEETAVNQFGKGDKYFGVAVMMVTLPGLPMFGHGQIEGFSEKYGMEYKRAYYDEVIDDHLVWRHKREIFPLLKMRHLFSQVDNFELYDYINTNEQLNENVFAYSNKSGNETAFVIYNNSYETCEGKIKYSNPKSTNGNIKPPKDIAAILSFKADPFYYYIYTDHRTQLQFLLSGKEVNQDGFKIKLFGYQYRICLNFREVYDENGAYKKLLEYLNGKGVASIDEALLEMEMIPLHSALEEFLAPPNIREIRNYVFQSEVKEKTQRKKKSPQISPSIQDGMSSLMKETLKYNKKILEDDVETNSFFEILENVKDFYELWWRYNKRKTVPRWMKEAETFLPLSAKKESNNKICIYSSFLTVDNILTNHTANRLINFDRFLLAKPIIQILTQHADEDEARANTQLIKSLIVFNDELKSIKIKIKKKKNEGITQVKKYRSPLNKIPFSELLINKNVSNFLHVNKFGDITYFNKERFENLIEWLYQLVAIQSFSSYKKTLDKLRYNNLKNGETKRKLTKQDLERELINSIKGSFLSAKNLKWLAEESGYNLTKLSSSLININKRNNKHKKEESSEI
ncbi:MAG: alpha-amylase [Bacteroidetes bacterium]|nr:alpha-amylase [Bacteroidota bacterium]